jgi:SAM-dependent methyltransferase
MSEITEVSYWDDGYRQKDSIIPSAAECNENYCEELLINRIRDIGLTGKRVLEIGGGGSALLARLALDHPKAQFMCLDYSERGCALVKKFAADRGLSNLDTVLCDFRNPPADIGKFDFVYSIGVVEHFTDLAEIIDVFASYLAPNGKILTMIPNMVGSLGFISKLINRAVYDIHVPYDREDLANCHSGSKLKLVSCDYFGSSNFGVLSSCVKSSDRLKWQMYLWLSRVSKVGFMIERRFWRLPTTKLLSPYILAVAERR